MSLAGAAAVYLVAAVVLTFPLAVSLTSRLGALQGPGDPYLNLWILGWGLRAWTTDPMSVVTGRVFDANIFFPAERTLTYSDHFLLQALLLTPLHAITGNVVLAYNVLLIVSIAASGLAMHALVRELTGSGRAALVAGVAWACWPYRTAHLLHIQLQALYFIPLALLFLHRLVARARWQDTVLLALVTWLQIVASVYNGLFTLVSLAIAAAALAISTGQWRSRRLAGRLAMAGVLTGVLSAPVLLPYAQSQQDEGFGRTLFEAANHSAAWQSYAQVPPVNAVYGATGLLAPRAAPAGTRDRTHVEHQLFVGVTVLVAAAVGLWSGWRRDTRPTALVGAALVACGVMLSLGPEGWRTAYAWLHDHVYGFQAVRAPARFAVVAMLGICLLAGLGVRALERRGTLNPRRPGRAHMAIVMLLPWLLLLEYANVPLPLVPAPPRETAVGQWLASATPAGPVLHLPLESDIGNTPYMVQSLEHFRPIVNGYSGQRPAFFNALVESLAAIPSPEAWLTLNELGVRFVVSPSPLESAGDPSSPLVERARFDDASLIYEVAWSPAALAALSTGLDAPAPPRGRAPFAAGETLVYDVYWDSGPMNVPAGTATLHVVHGDEGSERWEFEVVAATAPWVTPFFEARDRFVTSADAALLPIEHRREIREGRRRVDRVYRYDRARGVVQTADVTLPLGAADARDAVTTLYYLRTLSLEPNTTVLVPMNEGGASMRLTLGVHDVETIDMSGGTREALRVTPRIVRRQERRRAVDLTLWLTNDARRVPLRVLVDAGFGRVRLEWRAEATERDSTR